MPRETDRKVEARKGSLNLADPDETVSLTVPSHLIKGRQEIARPYVVLLLIVMMAGTAVFAGACGVKQVGDLQRQSQSVDVAEARSVRADLRMGAGELNLTGGADALMEADFTFKRRRLEARGEPRHKRRHGELIVKQGSGEASASAATRATSGICA